MHWILRIFLGAFISVFGFFVVWKSRPLVDMVGVSAWAEEKLGSFGGTDTFIKLIGIVTIFVGFVIITALQDSFLGAIVNLVTPARV